MVNFASNIYRFLFNSRLTNLNPFFKPNAIGFVVEKSQNTLREKSEKKSSKVCIRVPNVSRALPQYVIWCDTYELYVLALVAKIGKMLSI